MALPLQAFVAALALGAGSTEPQVILEVTCPSEAVKAAITIHRDELRACYERRLAQAPGLSSTSVLEWTVRSDGTITAPASSALAADFEDPELRDCVVGRIRSWAFPAPEEPVDVTLVVGFSRKGGAPATAGATGTPGPIDREALRKVVAAHAAEVQRCYDQRLAEDPKLAGKVVLRWIVNARGGAENVTVWEGTTLEDPALHQCMKARVATWRFPAPANGGTGVVTYPWVLRSSAGP